MLGAASRRYCVVRARYATQSPVAKASTLRDGTYSTGKSSSNSSSPFLSARAKKDEPHNVLKVTDSVISCPLSGFQLLNSPLFNKGTAFTERERNDFKIAALLPPQVNTLDEQIERTYKQLSSFKTPLHKNDFLSSLRTENKTLYFALVKKHIRELVPIIYTPTEGDAIASYSHRLKKSEGLFLDITDPESIGERLAAFGKSNDIDYIVVSDSEGILGIGDQGVGGVRISVSKLALMTLCAGIHPGRGIPICLDVGTNNKKLARDELYTGNRFARIRGKQYDEFIEKFINQVKLQFPKAILHFEDFGVKNARRILNKYRYQLPCFNDDIQGTGAVVMASLIASLKHTNRKLGDPATKIIIYGAGTAGLGIADQIVNHMVTHGLQIEEARSKIYIMDRRGLVLKSYHENSTPTQNLYAKPDEDWSEIDTRSLFEIVSHVKPTCLIGCSTQAGAFNEEIVKEMYKHNSRPIIFPLSNPTRLHEAFPEDILEWTDYNALVATGSSFPPVNGYRISENNNCFAFPGIGLGAMLARASIISDTMISAAVDQLASLSPLLNAGSDSKLGLLPPLEEINETSAKVAAAVLLQSFKEGTARVEDVIHEETNSRLRVPRDFDSCVKWVKSHMWEPIYKPMKKVEHDPAMQTYQT